MPASPDATPRLARLVILATIVIEAMGIGIILPVMPGLMREVLGVGLSEAALWGGLLVTGFAAMQFLWGPLIGNLSDSHGRRQVVLISLGVMVLDYVIMALAQSFWLLLVGRLIAGATAAVMATALAYMADISTGSEKAKNFGLVQAGFGMGFVLGPALGGLVAEFGTRAPFWAAGALCLANFALALFVLPESLPAGRRRPFELRRANPLTALAAAARLPGLRGLMAVYLLYLIGMHAYGVVWPYFGEARFGWDTRLVGLSLSIYGIALVLVQALCFGPVYRRFGARATVLGGLGLNVVFMTWLTFIRSGPLTLVLTPLTAFGELPQPALAAMASDSAPEDAQGEIQGVLASLQAVAMVITPLVMTGIFSLFTREDAPVVLPGAPFGAAAVLMALGIVIFAFAVPKRH